MLEAPPGSLAERMPSRTRSWPPAAVTVLVVVLGALMLGALMVGLGLLLTHGLQNGALARWDEHGNKWFVAHRSPAGNSITSVATMIGSTQTVLIVAAVSVIVLAIYRLWREIAVVVIALTMEVLIFLMTSVLVNRPRPTVPRLDAAPPTSSFPSGHTAAAIALWVSLAIVISLQVRNAFARAVAWFLAVAIPLFVGISRLYRGMHHPTDVIASVVLGTGAVMIALLAVRVAWAERETRLPVPELDLPEHSAATEVAS
jgi:membrane-associated phospholipid phosphatase